MTRLLEDEGVEILPKSFDKLKPGLLSAMLWRGHTLQQGIPSETKAKEKR
jgi:hypothetical protein